MEFKSLKNLESSFQKVRLFTLAFMVLCTIVVLVTV